MTKPPLETALAGIGSYAEPCTFDKLRRHLTSEPIATALKDKAAKSRLRRMGLEAVFWLTVARALFRHSSLEDLVVRLALARPGRRGLTVAPSAIPQARKRLGEGPVEAVFDVVAPVAAHAPAQAPEHRWRGVALYGVDGTTLRVPDTVARLAV
jgi:hypothetical protein